jgi:hypothetical protein
VIKKTGYNNSPTQTVTVAEDTIVDTLLTILSPIMVTGSIRFHTNPGMAEVWSGVTLLGTTDYSGVLLVSNLPIGNFNFVIKKTGYDNSSIQTITIVDNTIVNTSLITLSLTVAQAGFGGAGMIIIAGLAFGAMYSSAKKKI